MTQPRSWRLHGALLHPVLIVTHISDEKYLIHRHHVLVSPGSWSLDDHEASDCYAISYVLDRGDLPN